MIESNSFDEYYQGVCHVFLFFDEQRGIWEFTFVWRKGVYVFHCQAAIRRFFQEKAEELQEEFGSDGLNLEGIHQTITDLPEIDERFPTDICSSYTAILAFMNLGEAMDSASGDDDSNGDSTVLWGSPKETALA